MARDKPLESVWQLPDSLPEDLAGLERMIAQVTAGEVSDAQFRAFRVPMGVYEQREAGAFMLRVRLPAGIITPGQMRAAADVSAQFGDGVLHFTTRQDVQIHRVPLDAMHPALMALSRVGLSTRGGGGNTVRNITACPHAGVCPHEVFDVTPYVIALTERLLSDPLSFELPRKYKIAFSGCARDCAAATVSDVGFIARHEQGAEGFAVYAGGGMGNHSRVADLLEKFVPADRAHLVSEAVKRVFDQRGNRKNRHKARLRFLVAEAGTEQFKEWYAGELAKLRADGVPELRIAPQRADGPPTQPPVEAPASRAPGFEHWRAHSTQPQRQPGDNVVSIPLFLGDIGHDDLRRLADVVEQAGEGLVRATQSQNLVLRRVPDGLLGQVHEQLAALGLADAPAPLVRDLVACAGAATCRLGICRSRGLARAIQRTLSGADLDLHALGELRVNISGCPNSCGRHPVARVGLAGAARRSAGHLVPHYVVQLGGLVAEGQTRLATGDRPVPARAVPALLEQFLRAFAAHERCPDFEAFLDDGGREIADDLIHRHQAVPDFEDDKNYYFDWDSEQIFSLEGRGPGECSAGVFDLIEVDLASAAEALADGRGHDAVILAARALLVTYGEQPQSEPEVIASFRRHLVEPGLVPRDFEDVISAAEAGDDADPRRIEALIAAVRHVYDSMDASLRPAPAPSEQPAPSPQASEPNPEDSLDLRGVACPLNYVKTNLALEQMETGAVLAVLLDGEGACNVPPSVASDGHELIAQTQQGDHLRVLIRKR